MDTLASDWLKITMGHAKDLIGSLNCACDGESLIGSLWRVVK